MMVAALSVGVAFAQEADDGDTGEADTLEEIVVTGSRIFGQGETASPLVQVTTEDFFENPSATISEFFADNVTSNNVVPLETDENNASGQANTGNRTAGVNLWNLGEENSLTLLNGSRVINYAAPSSNGWYTSDINSVLPAIAMARADVLLDGGGAIYGTDAVAGVVNLVPRYGFEGFEFRMQTDLYPESIGDTGSNAIEGIWGTGLGGGMGSFVAAFDYRITRELDALAVGRSNTDFYPEWDGAMPLTDYQNLTGNTNDGNAYESMTPSTGMGMSAIPGMTFVDPLCGMDIEGVPYILEGFLVPEGEVDAQGNDVGGTCHGYSYPQTSGSDSNRYSVFSAIRWEFSNRVSGALDFGYSRRENLDTIQTNFNHGRGGNIGANNVLDTTIPVDHPARQYYMSIDPVWYQGGQPTRGMSMGMTVITPPAPLLVNPHPGIGFRDQQLQESDTYNLHGSLDIDMNETFGLQLGITYGRSDVTQNRYDIVVDRYENALAGLGGPGCDPATGAPGQGPCMYFNPFLSALLPDAATVFPGGSLANSEELVDYMYPGDALQRFFSTDLLGVNALLSIDTGWELPGGEILAVVGAEYRLESSDVDYNEFTRSDGVISTIASAQVPYADDQTIGAVLVEAAVPFRENLSMQIAGRYDDYSTVGGTFNPKVGFTWNVTDRVAVRTSYGTSFRAPTIAQTVGTVGRGSFTGAPAGGMGAARISVTTINSPAPDLRPQEAEHLSVGLDITLAQNVGALNRLSFSTSYVNIDFQDRIDVVTGLDRSRGVLGFNKCALTTDANGDGTWEWGGFYFTEDADLDGVPDADGALCWDGLDPDGDGIIATPEEVGTEYRNFTNLLATAMEGVNLALSSNWETPAGSLSASLNGTYTLKFNYQDRANEPVTDFIGLSGLGFSQVANVRAWKGNVRLGMVWRDGSFLSGHSTSLTLRTDSDIMNTDGVVTSGGQRTVDLRHQIAIGNAFSVSLTARNLTGSYRTDNRQEDGIPTRIGTGDRTYLVQFAYQPGRGGGRGR